MGPLRTTSLDHSVYATAFAHFGVMKEACHENNVCLLLPKVINDVHDYFLDVENRQSQK